MCILLAKLTAVGTYLQCNPGQALLPFEQAGRGGAEVPDVHSDFPLEQLAFKRNRTAVGRQSVAWVEMIESKHLYKHKGRLW